MTLLLGVSERGSMKEGVHGIIVKSKTAYPIRSRGYLISNLERLDF